MGFEIGDMVDVRVTKPAMDLYKKDPKKYELELGFPKTHLSGLDTAEYIECIGKVILEFGSVIRIELDYEKGRWEEDIHIKFLRLNKQTYREKRLKKILNKEKS